MCDKEDCTSKHVPAKKKDQNQLRLKWQKAYECVVSSAEDYENGEIEDIGVRKVLDNFCNWNNPDPGSGSLMSGFKWFDLDCKS